MNYVYQASRSYYVLGIQVRNVNNNGARVKLIHIKGSGWLPVCRADYATAATSVSENHMHRSNNYGISDQRLWFRTASNLSQER